MLSKTCLNGLWDFSCKSENLEEIPKEWDNVKIKVPSPFNINTFAEGYSKNICGEKFFVSGADLRLFPEYPEEWERSNYGFYKRNIFIPSQNEEKRYFLRFEAIAFKSIIYVNGKQAAVNGEAFLPVEIEITDFVKKGQENELIVAAQTAKSLEYKVDGRNYIDYPYGSFWGSHIAGIWQDVWLIERPAEYISDIYYYTDVYKNELFLEYKLNNFKSDAMLEVYISGHKEDRFEKLYEAEAGNQKHVITYNPEKIKLWDTENPNLYDIKLLLTRGGEILDTEVVRAGFRTFHIKDKKFMLNGNYINLKNDSWHYMGYSIQTPEYAKSYFKMAKDANVNIIRLHAQPFPEFFNEIADETGMLIVSESCCWASACNFSYNDNLFKNAEEHVKRLVLRDRNHPSVVMWSPENECIPAYKVIGSRHIKSIGELEDKLYSLTQVILEYDKTRLISCDGSGDLGGRLEVNSLHYPGYDCTTSREKVITIGEMGSMYYSTPDTVNEELGEQAMLSFNGRLEAVARDAYTKLIGQRKWASQICVFNLVWYGLEPLGFQEKINKYDNYETPGIKPTRIPVYMRALNAGIEEGLPEYIPNPVFEYARKAYKSISFYPEKTPKAVYAESEISFIISAFSDSAEDKSFALNIKLLSQNNVISEQKISIEINSCSYTEIPVSLVAGPADYMDIQTVQMTMESDGVTIHSDAFDVDVYNKDRLISDLERYDINYNAQPIEDKINIRFVSPEDPDYSAYVKKAEVKNIFASSNDKVLNNGAHNHKFELNKRLEAYAFDDYIDFNATPLLFLGNGAPVALEMGGGIKSVILSADLPGMLDSEPAAAVIILNIAAYLSSRLPGQYRKAYVYAESGSGVINILESINCDFEIISREKLSGLLKVKNDELLIVDGKIDLSFLKYINFTNFSNVLVVGLNGIPDIFSYDMSLTGKKAFHLASAKDNDFSTGIYSNNLYGLSSGKEVVLAEDLIKHKNTESIILGAAEIDWRKWNNNAEYLKTASIAKAFDPDNSKYSALSKHEYSGSNIYLCQLSPNNDNKKLKNLYVRMMTYFGVGVIPKKLSALDELLFGEVYRSKIRKALYKKLEEGEAGESLTPRLNFMGESKNPWKKVKAEGNMEENSAMAFYAFSPSDRTDLLLNPDTVSFTVSGEKEFELYLNKERIMSGTEIKVNSIKLLAGCNELILTTKESQPFPEVTFERYDKSPIDLKFGLNNDVIRSVPLLNAEIRTNAQNKQTEKMITANEHWHAQADQSPGMEVMISFNAPVKVNGIFFESVTGGFNQKAYYPKIFDVLAGETPDDMRVIYSTLKEEKMSYEDGKILVSFPEITAKIFSMKLKDVALKPWIIANLDLFYS